MGRVGGGGGGSASVGGDGIVGVDGISVGVGSVLLMSAMVWMVLIGE